MFNMQEEMGRRSRAKASGYDTRKMAMTITNKNYDKNVPLAVTWRRRILRRRLNEQARRSQETLEDRERSAVVQFDERGDYVPEAPDIVAAEATSEPGGEVQPRLEVEGGVSAETPA